MKIYTKFGGHGQTVLFDGRRVPKNHLRIETTGTFDELNSAIGFTPASAHCDENRAGTRTTRSAPNISSARMHGIKCP